jgi:hypothetical protein
MRTEHSRTPADVPAVHARSDGPLHRVRRQVLENACRAAVPAGISTREYLAGRRRRYIGPARLFLVSSLLLFATLKFATESINVDEALQFDPPKEPRAKVEPGATSEKEEKL